MTLCPEMQSGRRNCIIFAVYVSSRDERTNHFHADKRQRDASANHHDSLRSLRWNLQAEPLSSSPMSSPDALSI